VTRASNGNPSGYGLPLSREHAGFPPFLETWQMLKSFLRSEKRRLSKFSGGKIQLDRCRSSEPPAGRPEDKRASLRQIAGAVAALRRSVRKIIPGSQALRFPGKDRNMGRFPLFGPPTQPDILTGSARAGAASTLIQIADSIGEREIPHDEENVCLVLFFL